jgi:hypothetical protein
MHIFGIDFTSAPRPSKPITCAECILDGSDLYVEKLEFWSDFMGFESSLTESRSCVTAIDAPFGQPRRLVRALGWPTVWEDYVGLVGKMSKPAFEKTIRDYCGRQPPGDKHHLRRTDTLARACSPMMLYGVPVGKMFFEAAPRIAQSSVSVLPCRPTNSQQRAVEAYPALLVRRLIGNTSYKGDDKKHCNSRNRQRATLVDLCQSNAIEEAFDIRVLMDGKLALRLKEDASGDSLDAILCAIQVASAAKKAAQLGIPADADPLEGWIVGCRVIFALLNNGTE